MHSDWIVTPQANGMSLLVNESLGIKEEKFLVNDGSTESLRQSAVARIAKLEERLTSKPDPFVVGVPIDLTEPLSVKSVKKPTEEDAFWADLAAFRQSLQLATLPDELRERAITLRVESQL